MKIRPLHDRVLVRRVKEEEKSEGGIIIPDNAKEKPVQAKVITLDPLHDMEEIDDIAL